MRKEIDGLLVAEWTIRRDITGKETTSLIPTGYYVETDEEQVSLVDLLAPFYDPDNAVFVTITIQREDVDGTPI